MRVLGLADWLRAAGLQVVEVAGWETLGSSDWSPTGGIVHATADGAASNPVADGLDDASAIDVIRNGRVGLAGPIANIYHNRQGVCYVIASGRCNTAKTGWAGPLVGLGNTNLLGVEHENDNRGEPWPAVQIETAHRLWAVIYDRLDWALRSTAGRLAGHKEHQPGDKSDPLGINMDGFRAAVAAILRGDPVTQPNPFRIQSVYAGSDGVKRTYEQELHDTHLAIDTIEATAAGVAELIARPPVESAPVDGVALQAAVTAAVEAALMNPVVLARVADAVNDDAARRAAE